ncbi:MAG TPA: hypothetical protein PLN91_12855, partial [Rhodanobacteraceae bacterium]|nr:hypothetical protein [Rhodanobacteraceae bacterium]
MDLILRHANLPDGRPDVDIGIAEGRIAAVAPQLAASTREEIDVRGRLVSPPIELLARARGELRRHGGDA